MRHALKAIASILVAGGAVTIIATTPDVAVVAAPVPCRATPPADLTGGPAIWLGPCVAGRAQDLGVMRIGGKAPYRFFLGRMRAGRPVQGVLIFSRSQVADAVRFDAGLRTINSDPNRMGEIESVFRVASQAAATTSRRFKAAGNAGSAAFYAKMAQDYREPPFE